MLSMPVQGIAAELARDELDHVAFLRGALGTAAVPIPLVSIALPLPRQMHTQFPLIMWLHWELGARLLINLAREGSCAAERLVTIVYAHA